MIRQIIEEFLRKHAGWLVEPLTGFFETLIGPATESFRAYEAQVSVSPGFFEGLVGVLFAATMLVAGTMSVYVVVDLLPVGKVYLTITGEPLGETTRYVVSVAGYLAMALTLGSNPFTMGMRVSQDVAVVIAMFQDRVPDAGIALNGFTWGVWPGHVLKEFTLQVFFFILVAAFLIKKFTEWRHDYAFIGMVMVSLAIATWSGATNTDLLPVSYRIGWPIQLLVLWSVLGFITTVINRAGYGLAQFLRGGFVRYEPQEPDKRNHMFDALVMMVLFPVFGSVLGAVITWVFYKLWIIGGGTKVYHVLLGHEQVCRPNENGIEECTWTTGD